MFPYGTDGNLMASHLLYNGEDQVQSKLKIDKSFNINRREGKQSEYSDCATRFSCLLEFFVDEEGTPRYWQVFQA